MNIMSLDNFIIDYKKGDVNGNNILDDIYLIGNKPLGPQSLLISNITILIIDGKDGNEYQIIPKFNRGFYPTIFLGDFTNDGINNIMLSIFSGSTGGESYYYIYSFIDNTKRILFDFELFNKLKPYQIVFEDNYKVKIQNDEEYIIDLINRGDEYKAYIYDNDGNLKRPITGRISPLISLLPVSIPDTNAYKISAKQRLIGYYSADILGELTTILRLEENKFIIINRIIELYY